MTDFHDASALSGWFAGRVPDEWFTGPPTVDVDREEVTVVGDLSLPSLAEDADDAERSAAVAGRAKAFRESTREQRIAIASEVERRTGRKVSWAVTVGGSAERHVFTHLAAPVMTRLRQPERRVLDTLVDAGVARSRSDALAWSVRLVGRNVEPWLAQLRTALTDVERVRRSGPTT